MSMPRPVTKVGRMPIVDRRRPPLPLAVDLERGAAGVDAVARVQSAFVRDEVAVGNPSVRPRLSPWRTIPAQVERRPEEARTPCSTSPATTRPRMCVDETISPSHLDQAPRRWWRTRPASRSSATSPLAAMPEAEVLPHLHLGRAERADQHLVDELLRALHLDARGRKRTTTSSRTPRPAIRSALHRQRREQLRRGVRRHDRAGVWLERQDGVRVPDHRLVAEVDAVEFADGDAAGPGLGVGEPGDAHAAAQVMGSSSVSRGSRRSASAARPRAARRWRSGRRRP